MICKTVRGFMADYIDGTLDDAVVSEFENHISQCADCHKELIDLQKTIKLISKTEYIPNGKIYENVMKILSEKDCVINTKNKKIKHAKFLFPAGFSTIAVAAVIMFAVFFNRDIIFETPQLSKNAAEEAAVTSQTAENAETDIVQDNSETTTKVPTPMLFAAAAPMNDNSNDMTDGDTDFRSVDSDPIDSLTDEYAPQYSGLVETLYYVFNSENNRNANESYIGYTETVTKNDASIYFYVQSDDIEKILNSAYPDAQYCHRDIKDEPAEDDKTVYYTMLFILN